MMETWLCLLLSPSGSEEFSFSYEGEQRIILKGKRVNGYWVVDFSVDASPYFANGCNGFLTTLRCSRNELIRRYLLEVINHLAVCHVVNHSLQEEVKSYLD